MKIINGKRNLSNPPDFASSLLVINAAMEFDSCSRHGGASGKLVGKSLKEEHSIDQRVTIQKKYINRRRA